jgi:hypothetical protein
MPPAILPPARSASPCQSDLTAARGEWPSVPRRPPAGHIPGRSAAAKKVETCTPESDVQQPCTPFVSQRSVFLPVVEEDGHHKGRIVSHGYGRRSRRERRRRHTSCVTVHKRAHPRRGQERFCGQRGVKFFGLRAARIQKSYAALPVNPFFMSTDPAAARPEQGWSKERS